MSREVNHHNGGHNDDLGNSTKLDENDGTGMEIELMLFTKSNHQPSSTMVWIVIVSGEMKEPLRNICDLEEIIKGDTQTRSTQYNTY